MSKLFLAEKGFHYLYIGIAIVVCVVALAIVARIGYMAQKNTSAPVVSGAEQYEPDAYAPDSYEMPWESEQTPADENANDTEIVPDGE